MEIEEIGGNNNIFCLVFNSVWFDTGDEGDKEYKLEGCWGYVKYNYVKKEWFFGSLK